MVLKHNHKQQKKYKMKMRTEKNRNLNSTSCISTLIISLSQLDNAKTKSSHSGLQVRKSMKAKTACCASSWGEAKCLEKVLQMGHFPGLSCCPGLAASYPRRQEDLTQRSSLLPLQ